MEKRDYQGNEEPGLSFEEYAASNPWLQKRICKCGFHSKTKLFYGTSSTAYTALFWWSYYSIKDRSNAWDTLSAYDEYELSNDAVNRSEAYRKAHNGDRKAAKHRRLHV